MKRKIFVTALLVIFVVALFGLQFKAMQEPGAKERLMSYVRDTPASIFWPIFIGFVVLGAGPALYIVLNQKRWTKMATRGSVLNARKVALSLWRVAGEPRIIDGCSVVRFRHLSWGRARLLFCLFVQDTQTLRSLRNCATVILWNLSRWTKGWSAHWNTSCAASFGLRLSRRNLPFVLRRMGTRWL